MTCNTLSIVPNIQGSTRALMFLDFYPLQFAVTEVKTHYCRAVYNKISFPHRVGHTRVLRHELDIQDILYLLVPVGGGAVITNDFCITIMAWSKISAQSICAQPLCVVLAWLTAQQA